MGVSPALCSPRPWSADSERVGPPTQVAGYTRESGQRVRTDQRLGYCLRGYFPRIGWESSEFQELRLRGMLNGWDAGLRRWSG